MAKGCRTIKRTLLARLGKSSEVGGPLPVHMLQGIRDQVSAVEDISRRMAVLRRDRMLMSSNFAHVVRRVSSAAIKSTAKVSGSGAAPLTAQVMSTMDGSSPKSTKPPRDPAKAGGSPSKGAGQSRRKSVRLAAASGSDSEASDVGSPRTHRLATARSRRGSAASLAAKDAMSSEELEAMRRDPGAMV